MQDGQSAANISNFGSSCIGSRIFRLLLDLFLTLLHFPLLDELVHLVEAVILLIDNHVIVKHVLVVSLAGHGHSELLAGQGRELARINCLLRLVAEQ